MPLPPPVTFYSLTSPIDAKFGLIGCLPDEAGEAGGAGRGGRCIELGRNAPRKIPNQLHFAACV